MNVFTDKVVWITGASSGIGRAVAQRMAHLGAKLVLTARRQAELEELAASLAPNIESLVLPADLTQTDDMPDLVEQVVRRFGTIDVLFHAAGISQRSSVVDTAMEVHRKIMEINYFSTVALTKAVLPIMRQAGRGHLAAVTSLTGKFGFSNRSAYAASKHALHGFFETLYLELQPEGISVTLVVPGPVRTDISLKALDGQGRPTGQMDDMQVKGMPAEECANKAVAAMAKGQKEVVIGTAKEKFGVTLHGWSPALFLRLAPKGYAESAPVSTESALKNN